MADEESELNENDMVPSSKSDFLAGDGIDFDDDIEVIEEDDSLSFSFGGSRGFEE